MDLIGFNCSYYFRLKMNYYQITSGLDSDSDTEPEWMVNGVTKYVDNQELGEKHKENDKDDKPADLHQAVQNCLAKDTLDDLRREFTKNTVSAPTEDVMDPKKQEVVVLRRNSSRNTYGLRASQRFSRILEGTYHCFCKVFEIFS